MSDSLPSVDHEGVPIPSETLEVLLPGYTQMRVTGTSVSIPLRPVCVDSLTAHLVGNNIPVFFIQDAIKFPDLVHAVKPEPHNEIPQAQTAHDNAWDFMSLHPQSSHMQMVRKSRTLLSDVVLVDSLRSHDSPVI